MTIRKATRAGRRVLVIDIQYKRPDGRRARYRHDAQVQTMDAARAEERRLLAQLAATGEIRAPEPSATRGPVRVEHTFDDAVTHYRNTHLATLKPSTRHGYEAVIEPILLPKFGKAR